MRIDRWIKKNTTSLKGKRVVISGSTGGLGMELCRYLCDLGASLILLDRNSKKSLALAADLRRRNPDVDVEHLRADMADISSVRAAADLLCKREIDYLILNAGAYSIPRYKTDLGYDNVFQINFISPYYLARRLLPKISGRGGKIVAVGSIAHNYSHIDENDVDFATRGQASLVYGNAKRFLTYSLFAMGSDVVSVAHPGISFTGITNHYPPLIFALIKHPMKIIFMPARRACLSILYALFSECNPGEWIGPWLFDVWGLPLRKRLRSASKSEAEKIASIANKIYREI